MTVKFDELTIPQQAAVSKRGSILVSAAAGSGKTAVLVQRIIHKLTSHENPLSADRLLVVTFTVAAAGEMRSRLEKGLDDYCREHPEDTGAKRQKLLLQSAKICTIDSFCIDMVRENFSKAGVSPDFKIAEDKDILLMNEKAMSTVFEKYFESEDKDFLHLLDAFGSVYDERNLMDAVEQIYEKSQNLAFPEIWLHSMEDRYTEDAFDMWCTFAFDEALRHTDIATRYISAADEFFANDELVAKGYSANFNIASEQIKKIKSSAEQKDWDKVYLYSSEFSFGKFGSVKGSSENINAVSVKSLRKLVEAQIGKISALFSEEINITKQRFLENAPTNKMLIKLASEYSDALKNEKKEKNLYTFSDIEHLAFSLICAADGDTIVLRDDAKEYIDNYDEILLDEYQDVNDLQDAFFYYLSDLGKHLFAVGDVKQSIYGFRGANPDNFIAKMNRSVDYEKAGENDLKSIVLDANFRSRKGVCDCVNFMFDRLMTKDNCGISYMETERLSPLAKFPESSAPCSEFHFVDSRGESEKEAEASHIADCIENIMNSGEVISDKLTGKLRKAKYSDFAVLMRAMKGNASFVVEELKRRAIPVSYTKDSFLQAKEIGMMLSLLGVIDNPTREVELLATMMSPMFRFTPDDMAEIRCTDRKSGLYSAVIACAAKGNDACKKFLEFIGNIRRSAVILPLPRLISKIYDTTNLLNIVEMMPDGQARKANLIRLLELASSFSNSGNNSIGNFLNNLKKLDNGKIKGASMSAGSDSVKIMSVHNSKGLQFPVCFFAFTGVPFNTTDQKKSVIIDANYGVSFRYFDEEEGSITTLDKKLLSAFSRKTLLKEELRMFYVAATRAQERLIITMSKKDPASLLSKTAVKLASSGWVISEDIYFSANCYGDWILPCMLLHKDGEVLRKSAGIELTEYEQREEMLIDIFTAEKQDIMKEPEALADADEKIAKSIKERIEYKYPFNILRSIEAKASVSDIVHKAEKGAYDFTSRPGFLNKNGLTPTDRGTAVHKIMQFMDFAAAKQDFDSEIERLKEWEFINEEEANVDTVHIRRFVRSELFDRISGSKKVEREMRFLTYMPANLIEDGLPSELCDEQIIVQGAVDLMFYEDDGIVIVDFKTDRVKEAEQLVKAYGEQLRIYSDACQKITGLPVKEKIIYSLVLDSTIVV